MSDPALSPAQLDRLEDALEDLERSGIPAALLDANDADARPVADTLEVYRSILVMSREALPAQDVPAGLLDDVLAEARRAAAAPAEELRARVPWWRRLGGWGPAVAFAGTAALLVVFVRPAGEDAPVVAQRELAEEAEAPAAAKLEGEVRQDDAPVDAAPEADALEQDTRLADAQARAEEKDGWGELGGEGSELRGGAIDTTERSRAHSEPAADPAAERDADDDAPAATTKKSATTSSSSDKMPKAGRAYDPEPPVPNAAPKPAKKTAPVTGSGGGAPGASTPSQPATPPAIPGDDETKGKKEVVPGGWDDIASGDAKRRAGACSSAKVAYQRAREDDSAEVRARALAGLGLCELQAGNASTAEGLFAKARATDPKVGKLIESERARHEPKDQAQYEQQADESPAP